MLIWSEIKMIAWALGILKVIDEKMQAKLESLRFSDPRVYRSILPGVPLIIPITVYDFKRIDPTRFTSYPISFGQYYIDYFRPLGQCEADSSIAYKVFEKNTLYHSCPTCNALYQL